MSRTHEIALIAVILAAIVAHIHAITSSTTYNLLDYSQVHITKTTSKRVDGYCATDGVDYKCNGYDNNNNIPEKYDQNNILPIMQTAVGSSSLQERIKNDEMWKLVFDDHTKEIDIDVTFQRVSAIAFLFFMSIL